MAKKIGEMFETMCQVVHSTYHSGMRAHSIFLIQNYLYRFLASPWTEKPTTKNYKPRLEFFIVLSSHLLLSLSDHGILFSENGGFLNFPEIIWKVYNAK